MANFLGFGSHDEYSLPYVGMSSSPGSIPPTPTPVQRQPTIDDLSIQFPAIGKLVTDNRRMFDQNITTGQTINTLINEVADLKREKEALEKKLSARTTFEKIVSIVANPEKPDECPVGFDPSVLWSWYEAREDPLIGVTPSNPNRPKMVNAIRFRDGRLVSQEHYTKLKDFIIAAYRASLKVLRRKPSQQSSASDNDKVDRPLTVVEIKTKHPTEWALFIEEIISKYPEAGFCAGNWKIENILRLHIQSVSNNIMKQGKRQRTKGVPVSFTDANGGSSPPDEDVLDPASTPSGSNDASLDASLMAPVLPLDPQLRPPPITPAPARDSNPRAPLEDVGVSELNKRKADDTQPQPPGIQPTNEKPPKRSRNDDAKAAAFIQNTFSFSNSLAPPGVAAPGASGKTPVEFDVAHLTVKDSADNLEALFLNDFKGIRFGIELLKKLRELEPHLGNGTSLPALNDLIVRVEHADPNDPRLINDEDQHGAQWGHDQWTAGGLSLRTALQVLSDLGSSGTAYRLLAAAVKTWRVAEFICYRRRIRVAPASYLAYSYIQSAVDQLWNLVKDVTPVEQGEKSNVLGATGEPGSTLASATGDHRLNELTVKELKDWIAEKELAPPATRSGGKPALVNHIAAMGTIPNDTDMKTILDARKAKKKK